MSARAVRPGIVYHRRHLRRASIAQVQVQNRLQQAMPVLPQIVQQQGDGSMDRYDIGDWVATHVVDPMSRVRGVGNVQQFGSTYAMRIWLDPGVLNAYGLTPDDIIAAVQAQNAQITVGQLGGAPSVAGQELNATISSQSRLTTVAQFRNIVVRGGNSGSILRLSDVARVELGAADYSFSVNFNGHHRAARGALAAVRRRVLPRGPVSRAPLRRIGSRRNRPLPLAHESLTGSRLPFPAGT